MYLSLLSNVIILAL